MVLLFVNYYQLISDSIISIIILISIIIIIIIIVGPGLRDLRGGRRPREVTILHYTILVFTVA